MAKCKNELFSNQTIDTNNFNQTVFEFCKFVNCEIDLLACKNVSIRFCEFVNCEIVNLQGDNINIEGITINF